MRSCNAGGLTPGLSPAPRSPRWGERRIVVVGVGGSDPPRLGGSSTRRAGSGTERLSDLQGTSPPEVWRVPRPQGLIHRGSSVHGSVKELVGHEVLESFVKDIYVGRMNQTAKTDAMINGA